MNFLQAQQRLARRRGATSSTLNTATAVRYKEALNEAHRQILRMPGLESLRQATVRFTTIASQRDYAWPTNSIARINRISEPNRRLEYRTHDWLDTADPDAANTTGTPWAWVPCGVLPSGQPSLATSVYVGSTSASDTGTAYIEGIVTGGLTRSVSVTMTGITIVNMSASIATWEAITNLYLSTPAVGVVTFYQDALGTLPLAQVGVGDTRAQYLSFRLYPTPTSAIAYTCDVLRAIPDMVNDTDKFLLPVDFEDLLLDKAEMKELRKQDDPNRYAMLREDVRRGEAALVSFVTAHPDWTPTFGGPQAEFSSLGSQFPADTVVGW